MSTWRPVSRPPRWLAWLPGWILTPLRWTLRLAAVGLLLLLGVAIFYFVKSSRFDLEQVAEMPSRTVILDRHDQTIEAGWGASRRLARREDLPDFLITALLAREDARFYEHPGVDARGLARACVRNLQDFDFTQGASTLSMQLARNSFGMREKSIHRKLLEIALTLRIERHYTKDQILTHYLNRIYFGAGCHGVEEAARTYFKKPVHELHEGECAMLVGIIRGPHVFSPFNDLEAARTQQQEVLDRLVATAEISPAESRRIAALPIRLVPEDQRGFERSYALQAIRRELEWLLEARDIRIDGLVVRTTLDPGWQLKLETALHETLSAAESRSDWPHPTHAGHQPGDPPAYLQCAAATLDSDRGAILALVGGRDFLDSRYDRSRHARRDLGTAFEPWIAAAAAERDKRVLPDKPLLTGRQLGPIETARIASRCGLGGPFLDTEDLFRGSAAATPLETATALATLAHEGKRPEPYLIRSITDAEGEVLFRADPELFQAIRPSAAREATELFEPAGASRCYDGLTGSGRDAWLLRLGPSGSTAIWLGLDDPARIAPDPRIQQLLTTLTQSLAN